jgi:hypothetical protein
MLVEHVVRSGLLLLAPQLLDLSPELRNLIAVELLLFGQLALVSAQLGVMASSKGVCFAGFCLELALQVFGISLLASLLLL